MILLIDSTQSLIQIMINILWACLATINASNIDLTFVAFIFICSFTSDLNACRAFIQSCPRDFATYHFPIN